MISEWFNEDVDKNVIINSINECIMKHNKVTVYKLLLNHFDLNKLFL